jgi:F-type H+-transporting ATPase subunit b
MKLPNTRAVLRAGAAAAILGAPLLAPPALAGGGGGDGAALLTPDVGLIFWAALTFFILMFILRKFAWGPLLGAIEAREKGIEDSIEQAKRDRDEAQSMLAEQRDMIAEARRERAQAVEQGKRDAEKVKEEILAEARKQREQIQKQTEAQVETGMRQAREELRATAVDLAIQAAEKLIAKNLDDATQRKLVEDHLADLERGGGSASLPN